MGSMKHNVVIIDSSLEPVEKNNYQKMLDDHSGDSLLCKLRAWEGDSPNGEEEREILYSNVPEEAEIYHLGLLGYLSHCYARHHAAVITPDMVWYTVLAEMAAMVKAAPEDYRDLFTDSPDKKDLIVTSGYECSENGTPILNMREFAALLSEAVPGGIEDYLIPFSTTNEIASFCQQAAFMDAVSPFYNYMMMMCGIPEVHIEGTLDDWQRMQMAVETLIQKMPGEVGWLSKVLVVVAAFTHQLQGVVLADWSRMFYAEECGSGGEEYLHGWILNLFRERPKMPTLDNWPTHISVVDYKVLDLNGETPYTCKAGLFSSQLQDNLLVPSFGYVIAEGKTDEEC